MKPVHVILLVAIECVFGHSLTTSNKSTTSSNVQCPAGSKLDVTLNRCAQVCNDNNGTSKCQLMSKSAQEFDNDQLGQIVHFELPACKNVTLQPAEFTISSDNSGRPANLTTYFNNVAVTTDQFRLSEKYDETKATADICYPLSPQLLQCPLRQLNASNYELLPDRTLRNRRTNEEIGFRDYYTSPESEDMILACNETIFKGRMLRCNFVNYTSEEYRLTDDGLRLLLLPTNTSIYRPSYTDVGNGTLNVCYPFSPQFTCCTLWSLQRQEYVIRDDHRLLDTTHDIVIDVGDYAVRPGGDVVTCSISVDSAASSIYYVYAVLYVVSAVCLCVAFVVHLLVPSLNFHAKPLLCHMMCMTVMYTALALRKFLPEPISPAVCYPLFVVTYYSAMASFFWLNVLSFDLWMIFANLQTTSTWLRCACQLNAKHSFYYYSVYALGLPVLFSAAVVLVDKDVALQVALNLQPDIRAMCWFNERPSAYAFLYGPMITVLAVNLALFVSTVFNLRAASRGAEVVNKKLNTQLLIVCFKLFIIMGFCWIGEAIAWTVNAKIGAYYVPDAINAIQGVIIFFIYICKPATGRLLRNKFCPRAKDNSDGKWTMSFQGFSQRTTSSSTASSKKSMADRDITNSARTNNNRKSSLATSDANEDNSARNNSAKSFDLKEPKVSVTSRRNSAIKTAEPGTTV